MDRRADFDTHEVRTNVELRPASCLPHPLLLQKRMHDERRDKKSFVSASLYSRGVESSISQLLLLTPLAFVVRLINRNRE
jgi:hypothetical protein